MSRWTDDPVAEITCTKDNIIHLTETVKRLTDVGIYSDVTVLDIAKSPYYDFSNITDSSQLIPKDEPTKAIFNELIESNYFIHMKDTLLSKIYEILPAELKCGIGFNNMDHITIDSDGRLRLCLRIRGTQISRLDALDLDRDFDYATELIQSDYNNLCKGCSWTCPLISQGTAKEIKDHGPDEDIVA